MSPLEIVALATDYDRTLTDESLTPVPEALDALRAARASGLRIVVVSGRDMAFLEREVGDVADAIVAENGCHILLPGERARPTGDGFLDLRKLLADAPFEVEHGLTLASVDARHRDELARLLAGQDVDLIPNRDRLMVLPRGIDKAHGVLQALETLGIPPEHAAAAGDGENDVAMVSSVGYGIAVANAVDELKAIADHVTDEPGGRGLAAWVRREWLAAEVAAP